MFRAVCCSSSGGLMVFMQHLLGDCPVHRLRTGAKLPLILLNWVRRNRKINYKCTGRDADCISKYMFYVTIQR